MNALRGEIKASIQDFLAVILYKILSARFIFFSSPIDFIQKHTCRYILLITWILLIIIKCHLRQTVPYDSSLLQPGSVQLML